MSTEILPPGRSWPEGVELLAGQLANGATARGEEAALMLLFRDPDQMWDTDWFSHYVHTCSVPSDLPAVDVDWADLADDLLSYDFTIPTVVSALDSRQRALLWIACSFASSSLVAPLHDSVSELDTSDREALVDAVAHLCGVTR